MKRVVQRIINNSRHVNTYGIHRLESMRSGYQSNLFNIECKSEKMRACLLSLWYRAVEADVQPLLRRLQGLSQQSLEYAFFSEIEEK